MQGFATISPDCPEWAQPVLEQLLEAYSRHFDILHGHTLCGVQVPAMASFHSRSERYVMVKRAQLWAAECNEHVLFVAFDHLTTEGVQAVTALLERAERELVHPHSEHMYTYLSAVLLVREADPEAVRLLRRRRFRKNYKLSVHGWCSMRLAVVNPASKTIARNPDGRELAVTVERILFKKPSRRMAFGLPLRKFR